MNYSASYAYDKMGNITSLQRYDVSLVDNLTYTYNGNQLTKADDATSNTFGFVDGANEPTEYFYDHNGNLTKDLNKNITNISYNSLNLPSVVTFGNGSTITYTYAADGRKLRTVYVIDGDTTTTDYCGNVIYENGTAKLLLVEGGYVDLTDNSYHFFIKDHLGNNRIVADANGNVEESNQYYPFGLSYASANSNLQPYKYNGKELDTKNGLNWYDYGARHYDAVLGRFMTQDPLSEKHYSTNSYTYCLNNPLKYIDPLGKDTVLVLDQNVRPYDRGISGETYTAKIEVIQNGRIVGTYRGSSYPNSVSNSDNSTKWNTVKEGEYNYNNKNGHKGGTQKGLNIVDENGERVVPGKTPQGEDVEIKYANVHVGYSDLGGAKSRGSKACITIHPDDAPAFFSNFSWSSSNPNVGTSKGKIIIKRNIERK